MISILIHTLFNPGIALLEPCPTVMLTQLPWRGLVTASCVKAKAWTQPKDPLLGTWLEKL